MLCSSASSRTSITITLLPPLIYNPRRRLKIFAVPMGSLLDLFPQDSDSDRRWNAPRMINIGIIVQTRSHLIYETRLQSHLELLMVGSHASALTRSLLNKQGWVPVSERALNWLWIANFFEIRILDDDQEQLFGKEIKKSHSLIASPEASGRLPKTY